MRLLALIFVVAYLPFHLFAISLSVMALMDKNQTEKECVLKMPVEGGYRYRSSINMEARRGTDKDQPKKEPQLKVEPIEDDWPGVYWVDSTNNKDKYYGTVMIRKRLGVYSCHWSVAGFPTFDGVGMKVGNSLIVAWSIAKGDVLMTGVHAMERTPEGFKGVWTSMPGRGSTDTESWEFLRALPKKE